ncbi:phage gp8 protein, partial [Stappia sp. 22II-S9-Z10]
LPLGPHQSVDSIVYLDANHDTVEIDPTAYVVDYLDTDTPAVITRIDGARWPQTVSVTFTAGYGDDEDFTPAPIRQAILMDVAQMYERRESAIYGTIQTETLFGYHDLIAPFRVVAF